MTAPPLPSIEARRAVGRGFRSATPRSALAVLADRSADYDAVGRLIWQGLSRRADLLPIRYQRMLASPLSFYRGAALLMADDLARGASTELEVQICGDAHLSNFGVFQSPERRMVFDVNDFDETDVGPFEWDVKRLVSSMVIASAFLGHDDVQQQTVALDCAGEYRRAVGRFVLENRLDVWYSQLDLDAVMADLKGFLTDHAMRKVEDVIDSVEPVDPAKAFARLVTYADDGPRITADPPLIFPLDPTDQGSLGTQDLLDQVLGEYARTLSVDRRVLLSQFVPVDAAHKVVGVGSVGTQCYVVLLVGRDRDDPFLLQIKEAQTSVVALARGAVDGGDHGERVVAGQKMMQVTPDDFLGWHTLTLGGVPRSFYVRQLYDHKASVDVTKLDQSRLVAYGRACAWVLARAHARSGRAAEIDGYLGKSDGFVQSVAAFARAYRDRNEADYRALQHAVKEGRITVAS